MSRIGDINKGLDLAHMGATRSCPAAMLPILQEAGIAAVKRKPLKLSSGEARRFLVRLAATYELSGRLVSDPSARIPEDADRITLARLMGDEKAGNIAAGRGERISTGQISVRCQAAGPDYGLRRGTAVDLTPDELKALGPSGVILVENEAVFMNFDHLSFPVPPEYAGYLVVYRGGPDRSQKVCEISLIDLKTEVLVFPDYDPAGLVQALAVPHMTRILWPGPGPLEEAIRSDGSSSAKWDAQLAHARARLDHSEHPDVAPIWQILKRHGRVPAQEAFIRPA